jgi:hypothetical protein
MARLYTGKAQPQDAQDFEVKHAICRIERQYSRQLRRSPVVPVSPQLGQVLRFRDSHRSTLWSGEVEARCNRRTMAGGACRLNEAKLSTRERLLGSSTRAAHVHSSTALAELKDIDTRLWSEFCPAAERLGPD